MNKIFKVIFNRTTQKMEVVSELAKSQGKAASSTDERGSISLLVGGLKGSILVGGTALLMISAMPAEAVVSITGNNYYSNGDPTGTYIDKIGNTYAYNYYNPGSLSYNSSTSVDTSGTGNRYSGTLYMEGIAIGNNTTIRSRQATSDYNNGIAIGDHSQSIGGLSIAIGGLSKATDIGAVALGTSSYASGFNSFAAMRQSAAKADYAAAIGSSSWANATASFAIGASATALGERSFAIGSGIPQTLDQTTGEARRSIYDGQNNTYSYGNDAFSIGTKAKTNGNNAFAIGTNANAGGFKTETRTDLPTDVNTFVVADTAKSAENAFALGTDTNANSKDSVAFSTNASATGNGSISFGVNSVANGTGAIAFGNVSKTEGENAISIGWNSSSTEANVTTIGANAVTTKKGGTAIGESAKSKGVGSSTIGFNSSVYSDNATAIGTNSTVTATGTGGTTVGFNTSVSGQYGTAIAYKATASGQNALAVGTQTTVSGNNSGAFGQSNTVSGQNTFVLGSNVQATTDGSVILGNSSTIATAARIDSATVGSLTYSGFAGDEDVAAGDYVSVGSADNERQIKFVAPGKIASDSTDAINGSQLYATNNVMNNIASSVNSTFGGNSQLNPNGTITYTNIGGTGKNTIEEAIKAAKTEVKPGSNIHVASSKGDNGQDIYTVNAYNTTVSAATTSTSKNYIKVDSKFDSNTNTTNYAVGLTDDAIRDFTKDNDTVTGVVDDGKDYVKVEKIPSPEDENRTYKVSLSDKAINEFTKDTSATVKAGSNRINVNGAANTTNPDIMDYTVDLSEITKTQIDNALSDFTVGADKNGQAAGITVNKDNKRFDIIGNNAIETRVDGNKINVDLSQTTKDQIAKEESVTVGDNLAVQQDKNNNTGGKNYHVTLNNTLNLGNDGSVTIGDTVINQNGLTINNGGPSITTIGINAGNKVITNVADGQNDTDAVNLRQLKAVQTKVEKGTNVASVTANKDTTGVTTYTINADGTTASADEASKDFLTVTTGEKNQDNVTDYKVGLTKKATDALAKAETAIQEFTTSVNGQTVETINKDNKDVGFVNGKGTIARNDNSNITFDVNVDDDTIKIGDDGKVTVNKDAVDTNTHVTGGSAVYADNGDATTTLTKNDGSSVTVTGIKNNFVNKAETSTDGKTATLTRNDGGTVNIDLTNTVNTAVNETTEKGFKISADNGGDDHVRLGETVTYAGNADIVTTVSNNKIDFKLSDEAVTKFTKDHSAKVEAADNTITVNATETKTIDGVITTIYKVAVNASALPTQIEYFSVNSTVQENRLNDGAKGINSIAIGPNATSADQGAIALGTNSNANGNAAAALGVNSKAAGTQATAVGSQANATANGATAIGRETTASAGEATAVGSNANATSEKATALGVGSKATDKAALAVGTNATASAQSAVAVGTQSVADKQFAVAVGMGAQATLENSVALGSESTVTAATPTSNATVGGITYTGFAGANENTNYVVSVGSAGKERQIQNVAAGRITSDSTDAINGSQLYAVADKLVKTGFNITADNSGLDAGAKEDNVKLGETVKYTSTDTNVVTTVTNNTIDFGLADNISVGGKPGKDGTPGKDGSIGVKGADGKDGVTIKPEAIVFHGVDGVNGKDGADGKDGAASIKVEKGAKGLDGNDGKDGESKTRIVYEKPNGEKEEVATLNDGLKFGANNGTVHNAKLNTQVDVKGAEGNTDWTKFDAGQNVMTQIVDNTITVALAKDLTGLNSATFGTEGDSTVINKDGVTIAKKDPNKSNVTLTEDGLSNGGNQITNVDSGLKGKDGQPVKLTEAAGDVLNNAVNVGDLKNTVTEVTTDAFGLKDENNQEFKQNLGTTAKIIGDGNVKTNVVEKDGGHALEVSLANNITVGKDGEPGKVGIAGKDGKDAIALDGKDGAITVGRPGKDGIDGDDGIDGTIGVNGKDGSAVVLNGKDGSIGLNGTNGKDGLTIKGTEGKPGLVGKDGLPGKDGVTRIQYQPTDGNGDPIGEPEQVATLNDGLHFKGDDATLVSKKLNETLEIIGGADKDKLTANNIGVNSKDGKLSVQLAKDLKDLNSATFKPQDGENGQEGEGPTTVVNNNGVTITPKDGTDGKAVKLTEDGLDNGGNQIVNVKSGIDGVNGQDGQPVKSVNDLTEEQLKEVGTNAANINDVRNATDDLVKTGFKITADNSKLADDAKEDTVELGQTVEYRSESGNIVTTVHDNKIDFDLANNLNVGGKDGKAGSIGVKGQDGKDGVSIKGDNGQDGTPGEATITVGRNGKDGENGQNGDNGIDGKVGVNGKDGSAVVLNGKDGSIGLNGKDGKDGLTFKSADGAQGVDGINGKDGLPGENGKTRIVYQPTDKDGNPIKDDEGNPITEEVATLNDGLIFAGNNDKLNRHKLNSVVNIVGEVAQGINDKLSSENFKSAAGNINVVANEKDQLEIQLNRELKDLTSAKFVEYKPGENGGKDVVDNTKPSTEITNNGITITPAEPADGNSEPKDPVKLTQDGLDNGNNQIVNVKSGIDGLAGKDGINGKDGKPITSVNDLTDDQLKEVGTNAANINDVVNASNDIIEKGFSIAADNGETDHVKLGETVKYTSKDKNIITTVSDNVIDFTLNNDLTIGGPGKDGQPGKDGSIGVKGADGTAGVTLNGKDGSIGLTGPKGADGKDGASATISVKDGAKGLDGNDGKDGESKTRIVYEKPDGTTEEVATLNDGLRFIGDDGKVIDKKLNETLQISGGDTDLDDLSDDNIGVVNKDGKLVVKLAKNIDLTDEGSITIGDTFIDTNVVGVGDSALTGDSLTVGGDNAITVDGNKGTIGGLTNKTFDPNNFTSGQAATEDQLKQVYDVANSGWDIAANGKNSTNVGPKGKVSFNNEDGNIIITKETTDNNVTFALNNDLTIGGPGKNGQPGKDGAIGVKGADGKTGVALNGKDGTIGINGKDGSNGTMTFEQGKPGVDGKDGETKTRIVYETKDKDGNPVKEEVATLNDGLKFVGDDGKVITKKLNETLSITGGEKDATKLSDANNIGVVNNNGTLTVKLAKDIDLTKDGSVTIGDTTVNNDGLTIKDGPSVTKNGINAGDKKITNVKDGELSSTSKDAVNGSQLYQVQQVANAGWNLTANGKDKGNVKPGATVDLNNKDGNIVITKEGNNVTFGLNNNLTIGGKDGKDGQIGVAGKDGKDGVTIKGDGTILAGRDGKDGVDGSIGATGKDGASAVLNGKDGSIGLTGPKGADGKPGASANIKVQDGAEGVDGTNGKDGLPGENGKTRIVYETKDKDGKPVTEQVATLNDGLIFSGNNEDVKNRQKLNTEVKVKGEGVDKAASENFKSASGNINVKANGTDTLEVQLAKAIDLTEDGSVTTGNTTVNNNGLTIKDGPSVTKSGIDAKGTKITNVKDGDVTATSKDAVNGSQLYNAVQNLNLGWELTVNGEAESQRINNNGKVNVEGGKNIVVSREGSTVKVATSDNPEFNSVKVGGTTISSTVAKDGVNELNVAGSNNAPTRITNVAEGVKGTDAVNVNQLRSVANHVNNVDKDLRAGIAGALAAGNLYHVTQPGKSMVSAGVSTYRGQGALAVGYSRLSDNGKVGIKFSLNSDTRGHAGAAASVGYQW
ncbi:hypothetical protein A6B40_05315 [Mannheimia varigena]|uniref:YadA-like family protein n=1 Tax=Mannheimia varigena TaxID=85404 RepID=UPI001F407C21|nr:YadA-like family protein [Mannheimia varigena]QLB17048.1 hypothetical protein A6B40_05315 [Mannheimia varigena]